MRRIFFTFLGLLASLHAIAGAETDKGAYEAELLRKAERQIRGSLEKYCRDACEFLQVEADIEDILQNLDDLGFEGMEGIEAPSLSFKTNKIWTRVQIDMRVDTKNRDRLTRILQGQLASLAPFSEVIWVDLAVPEIGKENTVKARVIKGLEERLSSIATDLFSKYCPETCILSNVKVTGETLTEEQTLNLSSTEFFFDRAENSWLKVNDAVVSMTMSESMDENEKKQIAALLQDQVSFLSNANVEARSVKFPETFASRRLRLEAESRDPYGLDRLKKTMTLFKELSEDREQITLPASVPSENPNLSKYIVAAVVLLVVAGLIILVVARYGAVQREAMMMRQSAENQRLQYLGEASKHEEQDQKEEERSKRVEIDENLVWKLKADDLKDDIIEIITRNPKVARESFGRIIAEEGVEETSKYIHVLGNSVVFDLLKDPAHRRSLRDLSEYYQKSSFDFSPEEEARLLAGLKTKVLASELRVLTRSDLEAFEFLSQMDSPQIFTLINDEKSKIQSVVLAQLPSSKRRQVFELFKGESRISLMNELCDNGAITKDYLVNVARTLARKVAGRGGLDPETARASDIIQELLERVGIEEQRTLVRNLEVSNPDGARNIKMRLVTSYTLAYIKSGALLEIILDLEHEDLVVFLAGAPEDIAKLVIEQAPSELADALLEELESVAKVDDNNFRLVELKVLSKLRNMVSSGRVNLLEINEAMFSERRNLSSDPTKRNQQSLEKGAA